MHDLFMENPERLASNLAGNAICAAAPSIKTAPRQAQTQGTALQDQLSEENSQSPKKALPDSLWATVSLLIR
jgi:hypothetical protein